MKNTVLTILLLSLSYLNNFAKDNSAIIIECIVKDKALKAYLPYVNIYNETTAEGTITNINGLFRLKVSSKDDIIRLSMIGYETIKKRTGELLPQKVLYLEAKSEALNEVRVYADNSILYRVVNKCRQKGKYEFKRKIWHNKKGKCYFELKTEVGEKQSEHIECYYNGDLSTYHINGLQFKNGRAKLDTVETKYYLNTGTSHVFYMYELFNESSRFPISPLAISHSRLKKIYYLALEQTYKNENGHTCFVITFKPKRSNSNYFSGKLWVDVESNNLEKSYLTVKHTRRHPFSVLSGSDKLQWIDLSLTNSFKSFKTFKYPKSIDFNYTMHYIRPNLFGPDLAYSVKTSAVLYVYKYDEQFILPNYLLKSRRFVDYRRICSATYNNNFWDNIGEFTFDDKVNKEELFIKNDTVFNTIMTAIAFQEYNRMEQGTYTWKPDRYRITMDGDSSSLGSLQKEIRKFHYSLSPKIYLDISHLKDSTFIYSKTLLDLNESYYKFPVTPQGLAFINIYIDLVEIIRRELISEIEARKLSEKEIKDLYDKAVFKVKKETQKYVFMARGGNDLDALKRYNTIVLKQLGIDNVKAFGLDKLYPHKF